MKTIFISLIIIDWMIVKLSIIQVSVAWAQADNYYSSKCPLIVIYLCIITTSLIMLKEPSQVPLHSSGPRVWSTEFDTPCNSYGMGRHPFLHQFLFSILRSCIYFPTPFLLHSLWHIKSYSSHMLVKIKSLLLVLWLNHYLVCFTSCWKRSQHVLFQLSNLSLIFQLT